MPVEDTTVLYFYFEPCNTHIQVRLLKFNKQIRPYRDFCFSVPKFKVLLKWQDFVIPFKNCYDLEMSQVLSNLRLYKDPQRPCIRVENRKAFRHQFVFHTEYIFIKVALCFHLGGRRSLNRSPSVRSSTSRSPPSSSRSVSRGGPQLSSRAFSRSLHPPAKGYMKISRVSINFF